MDPLVSLPHIIRVNHQFFDKNTEYFLDMDFYHRGIFEFTVKPVFSCNSKEYQKLVFKTDYHLMQVPAGAFCNTFDLQ